MRWASVGLALGLSGCVAGTVTDNIDDETTRDYMGIAEPGDVNAVQPPELHDRASWGLDNNYASLGYPSSTPEEQKLFDFEDSSTPLHFFSTEHSEAEGVGPLFNQKFCLGCHNNSEQNKDNIELGALSFPAPANINQTNTPVSRGGRQGNTDYSKINKEVGNPPTVAFTLYGDFAPSSGAFDPIAVLGGPLQHVHATGECNINDIPDLSHDPILQGGIDPVTGLSPLGYRRATGERAAPPYVARGLMEAIFYGDLVANDDLYDSVKTNSTLDPQPDPTICPGDCISGRHNEGQASANFVGGDPLVRVGRFGLRGAGVTLLQFDVGGTQGELGMTSPFSPNEQPNLDTPNAECDKVPDPELQVEDILHLRNMIRNIAPPKQDDRLCGEANGDQTAIDIQEGARLFGLDRDAFCSRMTPGAQPVNLGDIDADHGIAADRQLGCVTCHIPIIRTGKSPAKVGGEHLSNRWAPIFSDLLIHKNPELPQGFDGIYAGRLNALIPRSDEAGNISRNLRDDAIPPNVTGIANGAEFRTPPLMGLGKVGPPFWHDARVYLNVIGNMGTGNVFPGGYPGTGPTAPAHTVFAASDTGVEVRDITTFDDAYLAAIEIHDLPPPPGNDYANCPTGVPAANDICSRASGNRGEARNVMEKFHNLTRAQQLQVVRFLQAL